MKRFIGLFLTTVMVLGVLAGCGGQAKTDADTSKNNDAGNSEGTVSGESVDPSARYEETVNLTSFFEISPTIMNTFSEEEINTCYYTLQQEEATNVHINYLWHAADTAEDAEQKKNVAIASGEIPDFMLVDSAQLALLAKSDLINTNIYDIYETYASDTLKAWTTADGDAALGSASYGGKVIAIPLVDSAIDSASFMWIRKDWLDKLKLEMPKTMDELYDVMVAFKTMDPDGDGKDDTYGMVAHKNFLTAATGDFVGLFNGFGAYPGKWIDDGNGGLKYGGTTPEVKEALSYLAKMYAEKLIKEDFSVKDDSKGAELVASGAAGIQYGLMWNAMWPLNMTADNDPEADWVACPIPSATGEPAKAQIALRIVNYVVVSKECKNPEAVIKLLNFWCYTQSELSFEEYDKYLISNTSGVPSFPLHNVMLKTWNPNKNYEQYQLIKEAVETGDTSKLNSEFLTGYNDVKAYTEGDMSKLGPYKTFAPEGSAFAAMDAYVKNDGFMMDAFTGASTPAMTQKQSIVTDKILEYYTKVIMGIESVDTFDSFVEEVNQLGLKDITAEVNEWYHNK